MWIGTGPERGLDGSGEPERELDWAGGSLPFRPNCAVWVEISNKPARDSLPFS